MHDLIAKLEALDGPSREVDGEVWCAVNGYPFVMWDGAGVVYRGKDGIGHYAENNVPKWTASLDAALALVKRVLPGWGFYLRSDKEGHGCGLVYPDAFRVTPCHCMGATPAIAMLLAMLKAKGEMG